MCRTKSIFSRILFVFLGILVLMGLGLDIHSLAASYQGQVADNDGEDWTNPLNLSQSGIADEPRFVVDIDDNVHVIWREDEVGSFFYTREDEGVWREPVPVELPFGTRRYDPELRFDAPTPLFDPILYADNNGRLFAFWLDGDNALYSSFVPIEQFGDFASWSERQQLAASAVDFAVGGDDDGNIHLSYIRDIDSPEAPAGMYYRKMNGQDFVWSPSSILYDSAYYRALKPENANIDISATGIVITGTGFLTDTIIITSVVPVSNVNRSSNVFTVYDNRLIEQVYVSNSILNGDAWSEPQKIDERLSEDSEFYTGPSLISVITKDNEVHLTWLAGHETDCELYHQWSVDYGVTWEKPMIVPTNQQTCPDAYELFLGADDLLYLFGFWDDIAFMQAWNGSEWSDSFPQPTLTRFVDPMTKRQISLNCQQTAVTRNNDFVVVGCGTGSVNDIWLLERSLGSENDWFLLSEASAIWSEPELVLDSTEEKYHSPVLLAGNNGFLHLFWIGSDDIEIEGNNAKIYYSQWNGTEFSRPVPLLHLNSTKADQLQGVMGANSHIVLMWRDPDTNVYLSKQVVEDRVLFPADWSAAKEVFEQETVTDFPDLFTSETGEVGMIYARPFNENRGLYLIRAQDEGISGLQPELIFDAEAAGWEMAGNPHMIQTTDNEFHGIVTHYELRPGPTANSIQYFSSKDGGETWSDPEPIAAGNVLWSEIVALSDQLLLIVWQQDSGEEIRLISTISYDNGQTWQTPTLVLRTDVVPTKPVLLVDDYHQAHLLQMFFDEDEVLNLQERSWRGGDWDAIATYPLIEDLEEGVINEVASAIYLDNDLFSAFIADQNPETIDDFVSRYYITNRQIDVLENGSISQLVAEPTAVTNPTPMPEPTQDPTLAQENDGPILETAVSDSQQSSLPILIIAGLIPAILLVGGVILLVLLKAYRSR